MFPLDLFTAICLLIFPRLAVLMAVIPLGVDDGDVTGLIPCGTVQNRSQSLIGWPNYLAGLLPFPNN